MRWTAPEGLANQKFSAASDVWSFGIVCIEVYMDGATPYPGIKSNPNVMAFVNGGDIHPQPPSCTAQVYRELCQCWAFKPEQRPTFDDMNRVFASLQASNEVGIGDTDTMPLVRPFVYALVVGAMFSASLYCVPYAPCIPTPTPALTRLRCCFRQDIFVFFVFIALTTSFSFLVCQTRPNTVPADSYDLGFQGAGGTELGDYDLGSEELGHSSRSQSFQTSMMHLREESTTDADLSLGTEFKRQGSHLRRCGVVLLPVGANCWNSPLVELEPKQHLAI